MANWYRWSGDSLELFVRVQPRASRDEMLGPQGDRLRIRLRAVPAEGKANEHLRRFLAKMFAVPKDNVELLCGATSREKRLRIRAPRVLPECVPAGPLRRG